MEKRNDKRENLFERTGEEMAKEEASKGDATDIEEERNLPVKLPPATKKPAF